MQCICPYLLGAFLLFLIYYYMRESFTASQITGELNVNVKRKGLPAPYGM